MEQITLEAEPRAEVGKGACRRARRESRIPSVIYGKGQETISITVPEKDFLILASRNSSTQVVTLKSSDKRLDGKHALVREIRRDFVKNKVLHVDLLLLQDGHEIRVVVPVEVYGDSIGVKTQGGVLAIEGRSVTVSCDPKSIPQLFRVDVTPLDVGGRIRAKDLPLPKGAKLRSNPMETLVNVISSKKAEAMMAEVLASATAAIAQPTAPIEGAAAAPAAETPATAAAGAATPAAATGEKKEEPKKEAKK